MTDSVEVSNMPESGSPERVAYDLCTDLRYTALAEDKRNSLPDLLNLYKQCRKACRGGAVDTAGLT